MYVDYPKNITDFFNDLDTTINVSDIENYVEFEDEKLIKLDLQNKKLGNIPVSIGELKHLRHLNLENNNLTTLPDSIESLSKLLKLSLRNNNLNNLPKSICRLQNLNVLVLDNNKISKLPVDFNKLSKLTYLGLRNNKIEVLPDNLPDLQNLALLDLYNNQIEILPINLGKIKNLVILNLFRNNISYIPSNLVELNNLESLYLSGNPLSDDIKPIDYIQPENMEEILTVLHEKRMESNKLRTALKSKIQEEQEEQEKLEKMSFKAQLEKEMRIINERELKAINDQRNKIKTTLNTLVESAGKNENMLIVDLAKKLKINEEKLMLLLFNLPQPNKYSISGDTILLINIKIEENIEEIVSDLIKFL